MANEQRSNDEQATFRRARILGLDFIDTSQMAEKPLYHDILTVPEMKQMRLAPLQADDHHLLFGITTTTGQSAISEMVRRYSDKRISFSLISDPGFNEYMLLYDPPKQVVYTDIALKDAGSQDLISQISSILQQVKADDMLAYLVQQAHRLNASDIHIETQADHVRIRFRIDGVLHVIARMPFDKYRVLIAAIASAGNISTGSMEAQQGHIAQKVQMADKTVVDVNVRLETVPTINGIDVVMRLFNMDASRYSLAGLGLSDSERKVVDALIAKPSGLVMMVGPTGSGKTTTLYSVLNTLNQDERKIITIEDPVEFQFPGITQISVRTTEGGNDDSFADKLRAVLRLDPDIVMVGEVRDDDTAKTALQAALTGHLVLTTFHASSACAALTRLAGIIGQNPLFVSAIRLIMAQRLVRRLDDQCKVSYEPSQEELAVITRIIETLPQGVERPRLEGLQLFKPGKSDSNPYGFKGQIALREQLLMTDRIRQVLVDPSITATTSELEKAAEQDGMVSMLQNAILCVVNGQTTLQEIFRVLG